MDIEFIIAHRFCAGGFCRCGLDLHGGSTKQVLQWEKHIREIAVPPAPQPSEPPVNDSASFNAALSIIQKHGKTAFVRAPAEPAGTPAPCPLPAPWESWPHEQFIVTGEIGEPLHHRKDCHRCEMDQWLATRAQQQLAADKIITEGQKACEALYGKPISCEEVGMCIDALQMLKGKYALSAQQQLAADEIVEALREAVITRLRQREPSSLAWETQQLIVDQVCSKLKGKFLLSAQPNGGLTEEQVRVENALRAILEIGKRDMSNPKYDGYFEEARAALSEPRT
jgi:hypothetical protein